MHFIYILQQRSRPFDNLETMKTTVKYRKRIMVITSKFWSIFYYIYEYGKSIITVIYSITTDSVIKPVTRKERMANKTILRLYEVFTNFFGPIILYLFELYLHRVIDITWPTKIWVYIIFTINYIYVTTFFIKKDI